MHVHDKDRKYRPYGEELAQKPLECSRIAIRVHTKFNQDEPRRRWVRLPESQLAVDAVLKKGWARRRQRTVVMGNEVGGRRRRISTQRVRDLGMVEVGNKRNV